MTRAQKIVRDREPLGPSSLVGYGLKFSLLLHVALAVWFLGYWAASEFVERDDEMKNVRPRQSIRVDVVDLPSLKYTELNKVDLTKEARTEPPKKSPDPLPVPRHSPTAMKLPPKLADSGPKKSEDKKRLEEIQEKLRAEAKRQEILAKYSQEVKSGDEEEKRPVLAGNIVSKGGSIQGDVANEVDEFTALVQTHVRKFWKAPPWSAGQNYKTRVIVKLSPGGRVLSKELSKTSGRPEFDSSALEAVEAADPFPAPPEFFKRLVLQEGIECGFPE